MHMPDALLSPAVAVPAIAVSGGALVFACRRAARELDDRKVPLMGVLGAFVFAAQMINLPLVVIPGVSWHLIGAVLMASLLGPYSSFVVMAAVLVIQALLLGDGGLLALGCNVLNMGVISCFLGYGIYSAICSWAGGARGRTIAALAAAIVSSTAAAVAAAIEIHLSGKNPVSLFSAIWLMGGVHFLFGIGEGVLTVAVLNFILKLRPVAVQGGAQMQPAATRRFVLAGLAVSLLIGGMVSWWASSSPDGLEHAAAVFEWPERESAFGGLMQPVEKALASVPFLANVVIGLATTALAFGVSLMLSGLAVRRNAASKAA